MTSPGCPSAATGHLSGRLVVELLGLTTEQIFDWTQRVDLFAPSRVSWAAADPLPAWFDHAREFTETWVHHQQIRHTLGLATDPTRLESVLGTFIWAFPHQYRVVAQAGTVVAIEFGSAHWSLASEGSGKWSLEAARAAAPAASLRMAPDDAWRFLAGGDVPAGDVTLEGPHELTGPLLNVLAVIA